MKGEGEGNELREGGRGNTMRRLVSHNTEFGLYQCNGKLFEVLNRAGELPQSNLHFRKTTLATVRWINYSKTRVLHRRILWSPVGTAGSDQTNMPMS